MIATIFPRLSGSYWLGVLQLQVSPEVRPGINKMMNQIILIGCELVNNSSDGDNLINRWCASSLYSALCTC